MSEVRELEIVEQESKDIVQEDAVVLAKAVAENMSEVLAKAPDNASEKVAAIEVDCIPVVTHKVTVRLVLR